MKHSFQWKNKFEKTGDQTVNNSFEGWPTRSSKNVTNYVFNKMMKSYRVFMYEKVLNWENKFGKIG
jgi:hypothetical protein